MSIPIKNEGEIDMIFIFTQDCRFKRYTNKRGFFFKKGEFRQF